MAAIDLERAQRRAFVDYRHAIYDAAVNATNGRMLNPRGMAAGIDSRELYLHGPRYFDAYASEELREHAARFPKLTFDQFVRQTMETPE